MPFFNLLETVYTEDKKVLFYRPGVLDAAAFFQGQQHQKCIKENLNLNNYEIHQFNCYLKFIDDYIVDILKLESINCKRLEICYNCETIDQLENIHKVIMLVNLNKKIRRATLRIKTNSIEVKAYLLKQINEMTQEKIRIYWNS